MKQEKQYNYIYKTICTINNTYYIGMHSTNNIHDGYYGSGLRLQRSIKKYGKENHILQILEYLPNRTTLALREKELVNESLLKDELCLNLAQGGCGGNVGFAGHSEESKNKISQSHKIRYTTIEADNKNSKWITNGHNNKQIHDIENIPENWYYGFTMKDISLRNYPTTRVLMNDETKNKISSSMKGKNLGKKLLLQKRKSPIISLVVCPHCNKEGCSNIMKRWHFDNCKLKIIEIC